MERLNKIREEIDHYDKEIVKLFEKRIDKAKEVLQYKLEVGIPIHQQGREQIVFDKAKGNLKNKKLHSEIEELYTTIMKLSRRVQAKEWNLSDFLLIGESLVLPLGERLNKKTIAYQGEPGAFGHLALKKYFQDVESILSFDKFEGVFKAIKNGTVDYGILPIENSSTGGIHDVYDLLLEYDLYIVGEQQLQIDHNLVAVKDSNIEHISEIYSHIQGFNQCKTFLNQYPHWQQIPMTNTAASAKYINDMNDPSKAAIASKEAADIYGLEVIKENIQTNKENWTRFIIIGKKVEVTEESKKISLIYSLRHNVGALYESLGYFVNQGINLVKVESRPINNQPWKYHFYIDIEGNLLDKKVQEAIERVQRNSIFIKVLGNY